MCSRCPLRWRQALGRCLLGCGRFCDDRVAPCFDRLAFFVGPLLVLFGLSLVVLLSTLALVYVIPSQCTSEWTRLITKIFLGVGLLNLIVRYIYAVATNPGTSRSSVYVRLIKEREKVSEDNRRSPPDLLAWSICRHSQRPKPPRAHFDSVNRQLVVNFDHWCPWLFNSVGYGNYRHFLVFIGWVWALCSVGMLLAAAPFFEGLKRGRMRSGVYDEVAFAVVFCLCFALSLAVGILFGWHIYLAGSGMTSVDFYVLMGRRGRLGLDYPNPFESGKFRTNLKNALLSKQGGCWELIFPPPPRWEPRGEPYPGAWIQ